MARERMNVLQADKTISLVRDQQKLDGYYIGYRNIETNFGPNKVHHFVTETGTVAVYGFGSLDAGLALLTEKASKRIPGKAPLAFIEYAGVGKARKGFKPPHLANVDGDLEHYIEGDIITNGATAVEPEDSEVGSSGLAASEYSDEDTGLTEELSEPPRVTASVSRGKPAATSSDTQSRVQAMLAKAKANTASTRRA